VLARARQWIRGHVIAQGGMAPPWWLKEA